MLVDTAARIGEPLSTAASATVGASTPAVPAARNPRLSISRTTPWPLFRRPRGWAISVVQATVAGGGRYRSFELAYNPGCCVSVFVGFLGFKRGGWYSVLLLSREHGGRRAAAPFRNASGPVPRFAFLRKQEPRATGVARGILDSCFRRSTVVGKAAGELLSPTD